MTAVRRLEKAPFNWDHPLIKQIRDNPQVLTSLQRLTVLLQQKGYDVQRDGKPSLSIIYKIMSDPEVKESVANLTKELQKAGIKFDLETLASLESTFKGSDTGSWMDKWVNK
ncbi:hypothetical protein BZG36_00676 [Bifiguratus adelaidae]|uniref:Uncharacterized protein n=1 Tax=Bifiguratus adelaidae TaxID=1938954 RepID=A0A261Y6S6_9FUNG|nr:hypothetical protein BZG36_00676 [Bifiguratus adelaidae]